ncbi:MAG: hypothetical protein CMG64_04010 [Candidatus Marinimicrobia bacterium]|nr:hypothetical protein [Candidatus Neomarinimicrobiota bacterium]|tara:strand:- start:1182 stop:2525 length:1344 start_codon:yes stop_codon:yes gene_type:complete
MKKLFLIFIIISSLFSERGDLLSFEVQDSVDVDDIENYLNNEFGDFSLSTEYSAIMYSLTYETIDQFGNYALASGMVAFPDINSQAYPLVSFQHGTQIRRASAPSMNGFNALSQAMVTAGYIYMEPDYLGLGQSEIFHPYHLKDVTASTVIDMLRAVKQFCNQTNLVQYNDQLFLAGYSEGGYATMAAVKEIEDNLSEEFDVTISFPMAGAYDLSGVMVDLMLSQETYPDPFYLPFFILAYIEKYYLGTLDDFFLPEYASILPELFSGEHSGGYINSFLPDIPIQIMKPEVIAEFSANVDYPFRLALEENNLYDWIPQNDMYLFHGVIDERVPYQNSVVAYNQFILNGSENVYFESLPESYGGHQDVAPYCLLGAYNIMSNIHMINDLGDINQDMFIDIIDAVQLVSIIIEDEDFSDYQYWASDINEDDVINILDVIEIINNILNMR